MERFVKRQNIAHYQALLEKENLDDAQRTMIRILLAEEEQQQTTGGVALVGSRKTSPVPGN